MSARAAGPSLRRRSRHGRWARVSESIESRLWPVPVAAVIVAVVLGIFLPRLDLIVDSELPTAVDSALFNGGADTARSVLSSIAGSLITATSLTFSLTVIALQLASSQASPRVLRLFASDRQVHWTLAAFLGTFAYSVTVLRSVRSATEGSAEFVPRISVTLAFVLTLVSVIMLVFFLAHLAAQLRVETMLKEIHAETDRTIDLVAESNAGAAAFDDQVSVPSHRHAITAHASGFITYRNLDLLVSAAGEHGVVVQETKRVGENVVTGTPLAFWWPSEGGERRPDGASIEKTVRAAYSIRYERTASQDIGYGVEQMVDIALRALSPAVNDPTTAAHALGHLSAITARTVRMPRLPAALRREDGALGVVTVAHPSRDDVRAALSPIRHNCSDHPAVVARFVQAVEEVAYVCDDREVNAELIAQLDALVDQLRLSEDDPAATTELLARCEDVRRRVAEAMRHSASVSHDT